MAMTLYGLYLIRIRFLKNSRPSWKVLSPLKQTSASRSNAEIAKLLAQVNEQRDSIENKKIMSYSRINEELKHSAIALSSRVISSKKRRTNCVEVKMKILRLFAKRKLAELESEDDRKVFLQEYGLTESGLNKLLRASYSLLDLITYFTAGEKEVRAWTIKKGWKAPQAAGVIHTDFEKGFIKAEVIKLPDYQQYKTEAGCRDAGKMAIEGKEYVVMDGDIMHFRFNV